MFVEVGCSICISVMFRYESAFFASNQPNVLSCLLITNLKIYFQISLYSVQKFFCVHALAKKSDFISLTSELLIVAYQKLPSLSNNLDSRSGAPKLSLTTYPFSISVDEHVPRKMGAGRIFSRQLPKVGFPGAVVHEVGVQGWKRTPKSFDLLNSGKHPWKSGKKWRPTLFEFKKYCPTFAEKHMNHFLEVTPKRVLNGGNFESKSHTKLFGQVWGTSGKNPSHGPKFACSYTYVQGLPQNIFATGPKSQNFIFTTRNWENNFFCKQFDGKMSNFKTLGALPSSQTPMPLKRFITKTLRKITKIYLLISI